MNISSKKGARGFTLVELLIVVIIVGILSSIALPTFLKQRDRARQLEAKTRMNFYTKLQIIYYSKNDQFVVSDESHGLLDSDLDRQTSSYSYGFLPILGAGGKEVGVVNRAVPKKDIKAFMAVVGRVFRGNQGSRSTLTVYCQSKSVGEGLALDLGDVDFVEGSPETGGGSIGCKGRAIKVNN